MNQNVPQMNRRPPWRHVHFTGIGGVGMAGLALILLDLGVGVSGTDEVASSNTTLLIEKGVDVHIGHSAACLPEADVLVYSSAVGPANAERRKAHDLGIPELRRGDFLAELSQQFPTRISCAGTHGKTTTSAMLSHILIDTGRCPGYLVGGKISGRDYPAAAGTGEMLVTEVDESDGTQSAMQSTHAIITNIEDDHSWSLGGMDQLLECFRSFGRRSDYLLCFETPVTRDLFSNHPNVVFLTDHDVLPLDRLPLPGHHNRVNASLAIRLAEELGVGQETALTAMQSFAGVDRRQSLRFHAGNVLVIEDYAHHPTEVGACIQAIRETYPAHHLHIIFQPHRYERISRYASAFSAALSQADRVTVTPPFAAWTQDHDQVDPRVIAHGITGIPAGYCEHPFEKLATELAQTTQPGDLIAVLGAGTITQLISPLTQALGERYADPSI